LIPYSEGIHDDAAKVIWCQAMWDPSRSLAEILAEYIRYEYDPRIVAETTATISAHSGPSAFARPSNERGPSPDIS
jgi:hypothetical protein